MSADAHSHSLLLPPEVFVWCIADVHRAPRAGIATPAMLEQLSDVTPVPTHTLHAVATALGPRRALVCALPLEQVRDAPRELDFLGPAALPAFVASELTPDVSPAEVCARLNALVGRFEAARARAHRRRRTFGHAAMLLGVTAALCVGMERRHSALLAQADRLARAELGLLDAAGGDVASLSRERDVLLRLLAARAQTPPNPCAASTLARLLIDLPAIPSHAHPQKMTAQSDRVTLELRTDADPGAFVAAVRAMPAWSVADPRLTPSRGATRCILEFTQQPRPAPAGKLAHNQGALP